MLISKTFRIPENLLKSINKFNNDSNMPETRKLIYMLEFTEALYKISKIKTRNLFTVEEGNFLIAMTNGYLFSITYPSFKQALLLNIDDSIELESYDTIYKIDKDKFLNKIEQLEEMDCAYLLNELNNFWLSCTEKKEYNLEFIKK